MLSAYVWSSVVVEMLADEPTWFDRLGVVEVDLGGEPFVARPRPLIGGIGRRKPSDEG